MTVIESLYEYFNACPLLQDGKLNVNFLPADQREYTIDVTPIAEIVKRYIDGSSIRQYAFIIASRTFYSPDVSEALVNCGLFEELADWMVQQTQNGMLPAMETGKEPRFIEAVTSGYLLSNTEDSARYQIQCRLEYFENNRRS